MIRRAIGHVRSPRNAGPAARDAERGQILILFTVVLIVILAFTALVVDLGVLRNNRQTLANAVDAGALAGGTLLPVDPANYANATSLINGAVQATYAGISTSDYRITYRCLIGTGAGNAGAFDAPDIDAFVPLDCDPRYALGHTPPVMSDFIGAGKTRSSDCRPDLGDRCNVVIVNGDIDTPFTFGRVVGVNQGNTGAITSAACRGLCGELPTDDFDVVLTIDTSGSMSTLSGPSSDRRTRLAWAQSAANELLDELARARGTHQVSLVRYSGNVSDPRVAEILVPLTTNFTTVRTAIAALTPSGNTPLKLGMAKGAEAMLAGQRSGAIQVQIFLSDGRPWPDNSTTRPNGAEVDAFRDTAEQVFSVAIGQGGSGSSAVDIPLMRSLAKPNDADHFANVVDASGLPDIFRQIAVEILNPRSHLIQVYPPPIVTAVGGGSSSATITGKYFTGATSVTFGGAQVALPGNYSDTSMTVDPPDHPSGTTVDVRVTTQGGSSPAYRFTYP